MRLLKFGYLSVRIFEIYIVKIMPGRLSPGHYFL